MCVSGAPGTGKTCSVRAAAAAWRRRSGLATAVLEVNCMSLARRTCEGFFLHLAEVARSRTPGGGLPPLRPGPGVVAEVAARLAALGPAVIVIADEVDQLLEKRGRGGPRAASRESLLALLRAGGPPTIALVAIANKVDLLQHDPAAASASLCESLLFQPYEAAQLRSILKERLATAGTSGAAAAEALGPIELDLGARRIAKKGGDCRQLIGFCEEAIFRVRTGEEGKDEKETAAPEPQTPAAKPPPVEAAGADPGAAVAAAAVAEVATPPANQGPTSPSKQVGLTPIGSVGASGPLVTPQKRLLRRHTSSSSGADPLAAVDLMPVEHLVLLCALTKTEGEAMRFAEAHSRYKELSQRLHQPLGLASKDLVASALGALEHRGLVELRLAPRAGLGRAGRGGGRGGSRSGRGAGGNAGELIVELMVPCKAVREAVARANPLLEKCRD